MAENGGYWGGVPYANTLTNPILLHFQSYVQELFIIILDEKVFH